MIDRQTIERIKSAANIVEVVSDFVNLRKSGANYKGLCPFHDEKTPSFMVSPSRGTYHCFGCGRGGNAVGFVMDHEQMTYPDALKWLGNKYGIEVVDRQLTDRERQEQNDREAMFIVNEWAADYFEDLLHNDPDGEAIGMQYFRNRGFRDDVIRTFRLGYDGHNKFALADKAKKQGYKQEYLLRTGLCYVTEGGKLLDRFTDRVVFPWFGLSGKVVGFSARVLDSRTKGVQQKYVNSPESDIYHKDRELFGLFQAKKAIVKEDRVYLVEGQTDVLSMAQCGIENVVANSGTALSFHQIRLLHRFTSNITLLYDGDEAGMHAALRGADMLLAESMNVKVLFLPDGEDPDSFARKHNETELRDYIEKNQMDIIEFKTKYMLAGKKDAQQRSEAIDSVVRSISHVVNPVLRDTYIHDLHVETKVEEKTLINRMNVMLRERRERDAATKSVSVERTAAKDGPLEKLEKCVAQMVVHLGERKVMEGVTDDEGRKVDLNLAQYVYYNLKQDELTLNNAMYQRILEETAFHQDEKGFMAEKYLLNHEDIELVRTVSSLLTDMFEKDEKFSTMEGVKAHADHLLTDYRLYYVREMLKKITARIGEPDLSDEEKQKLLRQFSELIKQRRQLNSIDSMGAEE